MVTCDQSEELAFIFFVLFKLYLIQVLNFYFLNFSFNFLKLSYYFPNLFVFSKLHQISGFFRTLLVPLSLSTLIASFLFESEGSDC